MIVPCFCRNFIVHISLLSSGCTLCEENATARGSLRPSCSAQGLRILDEMAYSKVRLPIVPCLLLTGLLSACQSAPLIRLNPKMAGTTAAVQPPRHHARAVTTAHRDDAAPLACTDGQDALSQERKRALFQQFASEEGGGLPVASDATVPPGFCRRVSR